MTMDKDNESTPTNTTDSTLARSQVSKRLTITRETLRVLRVRSGLRTGDDGTGHCKASECAPSKTIIK